MNQLVIIGNVGSEPVTRMTKDGIQVTSFNVAVNNKDKQLHLVSLHSLERAC